MIILSHRGYWLKTEEKNTVIAFNRSFSLGFGTETDIRDCNGRLVISHDIPTSDKKYIELDEFFNIYKSYNLDLPLALNIKSDGLQFELSRKIKEYGISNYFVFDMSVPDGLLYLKNDLNVFARQSEYELYPSFYDDAKGVWLDEFNDHWINENILTKYSNDLKKVCIVSPELHKRSYMEEWADYKRISRILNKEDFMICTDKPEEAQLYFNGN